jgi:hypothetical protein
MLLNQYGIQFIRLLEKHSLSLIAKGLEWRGLAVYDWQDSAPQMGKPTFVRMFRDGCNC